MILAIGVDIVDARRIEQAIVRWQESFIRRLFTDNEIRYCNNKKDPAHRFATRFAAKEALIKSLFPKSEHGTSHKEIEISEKDGRPFVNLTGDAKKQADKMGVKKIHLMLSHDGNYGVANVVLES